MRMYKIRSKDEKIIYQPPQADVKNRLNINNKLTFKPSVGLMCKILNTASCSFTFKITQSAETNISIGICDS